MFSKDDFERNTKSTLMNFQFFLIVLNVINIIAKVQLVMIIGLFIWGNY